MGRGTKHDEARSITLSLDSYWGVRGLAQEADGWTEQIRLATEDPDGTPSELESPAGALWLFVAGQQASRQRDRRQLDEAERIYQRIRTRLEVQVPSPNQKAYLAATYHQLGWVAQDRGRLGEAEDWYRKSLAISEELGDKPRMADSFGQLGLLAEARGQGGPALEWTVRCVTVFDEFPHPLTKPGPEYLARLTALRGIAALEESWRKVTGNPLPQAVREYVESNSPPEDG